MSTTYNKKRTSHNHDQINELNLESWSLKRTDPERGLVLANKAQALSEHAQYEIGIAHSTKNKGACLNWLSRYEEALKELFKALDLFERLEDKSGQIDTISCISISFYYLGDYHNDLKYLAKSYQLATEIGDKRAQADSLNGRGTIYYTIGKNEEAIAVLKQGLEIAIEADEKEIQAKIYDGLGESYNNLGRYKTALEYLNKCYKITQQIDMTQVESYALFGIGCVLLNQGKYQDAKQKFFKSLELRNQIGFQAGIASCYNKIAACFLASGDYDEVFEWLGQAEKLALKLEANEILRDVHLHYTNVYEAQENHKLQIEHLKKYYEYNDTVNHHRAFLKTKSLEFQFEIEKANHERNLLERKNSELEANQLKLEKHFAQLETLAKLGQEITGTLDIDDLMSTIYARITKLMKAEIFAIGFYNEEGNNLMFPLIIEREQQFTNTTYDLNDKNRFAVMCFQKEMEIVINSEKDFSRYTDSVAAPVKGEAPESVLYLPLISKDNCIGVITVQSFSENAYSSYQINMLRTLASYVSIALENAVAYRKVSSMQKALTETNKDILDSLRYARRIQRAILPPNEVFADALTDYFVLYIAKDIVSGDFYWCKRVNNRFYFAVVDCTGHGVPGAFMSIVGYNALNRAITESELNSPAEILDELDRIVTQTLHKDDSDSSIRDGMDLTLACLDLNTNELQVASAMNPFYLVQNGELIKHRGDRYPIGTVFRLNFDGYQNYVFQLQKGDCFYASSDGILDQFGANNGRTSKFKHTRYREMISTMKEIPMEAQKDQVIQRIADWRGELPQTDDICMIGIRV